MDVPFCYENMGNIKILLVALIRRKSLHIFMHKFSSINNTILYNPISMYFLSFRLYPAYKRVGIGTVGT